METFLYHLGLGEDYMAVQRIFALLQAWVPLPEQSLWLRSSKADAVFELSNPIPWTVVQK